MGRSPCCPKEEMNRGAWTAIEDKILTDYIQTHGEGRWRNLPQKAGLKRCGKSCRLRWLNYLRPDIKRGNISPDEEELIIRLHKLLGNRWSLIAGRLPGRTDNEIKNYWNTNLGKRVRSLNNITNTENNNHSPSTITGIPFPASPPPLPLPPPPRVVRTRAVKCTKVMLSHLGHGIEFDNNDKDRSRVHSEGSSDISDCLERPGSGGGQANVETTPSSGDFVVDFDLDNGGELFLADLLMDYSNDDVITDYHYVANNVSSDHDDHHLMLSEESTVPDWTSNSTSTDVDVLLLKELQNVGPEFHSLSSLILDGDCQGETGWQLIS